MHYIKEYYDAFMLYKKEVEKQLGSQKTKGEFQSTSELKNAGNLNNEGYPARNDTVHS